MSTPTTSRREYETETSHGTIRLDALAFAGAAAIVSAVVMLLLGIFGAVGVYEGAVEMMEQWHLFFEPTIVGTVAGMIEAAIFSFIFIYAFVWLYNVLAR